MTVFFHTSEHDRTSPQRSASMVITLPEAANDTLALARAPMSARGPGHRYSKAELVTVDLVPLAGSQRALSVFGTAERAGQRL